MALDRITSTPANSRPIEPKQLEELQDRRQDLVEQYVDAHPTGSGGWSLGTGIGLGAVGAGIGIGAVLLANRGKGAMYQGFNLMFGMPMALAAGGGIGFLAGSRIGEMATRPDGAAADRQVSARRDELQRQVAEIDGQLAAVDGRRPQPLPAIDDSTELSWGRVGGHAAAGLGIGLVATGTAVAGAEKLMGTGIKGGPRFLANLVAPAVAAGAISYLDQRDEAAGRQGSYVRAAGIGAAVVGVSALNPALAPIPVPLRLLGGAAAGAVIGSVVHMASASSRG